MIVFKFPYAIILVSAALLITGCGDENPKQLETKNQFADNPERAKQKTAECYMRLQHALKEKRAEIVEQISQDTNCQLASAAHAEHVNSGQIEAFSRENGDHSHHHH